MGFKAACAGLIVRRADKTACHTGGIHSFHKTGVHAGWIWKRIAAFAGNLLLCIPTLHMRSAAFRIRIRAAALLYIKVRYVRSPVLPGHVNPGLQCLRNCRRHGQYRYCRSGGAGCFPYWSERTLDYSFYRSRKRQAMRSARRQGYMPYPAPDLLHIFPAAVPVPAKYSTAFFSLV